jgi:Ca2+/H+ antiporter
MDHLTRPPSILNRPPSMKHQHMLDHFDLMTSHNPAATTTSLKHLAENTKGSVLRMCFVTVVTVILILIILDPPFIHDTTSNDIEKGDVNPITVLTWGILAGICMCVVALYRQHRHG